MSTVLWIFEVFALKLLNLAFDPTQPIQTQPNPTQPNPWVNPTHGQQAAFTVLNGIKKTFTYKFSTVGLLGYIWE